MLRSVVSSSTLDIHLKLFSHLLTCFYITLFHKSVLNPNLMYLTCGFYICLLLLLCPDTQTTSFAPFQLCMFLTDHWHVVYSRVVPVANPHLIFSRPSPVYTCNTSCISASEWRAAIMPSIYRHFMVKDANFFCREQILVIAASLEVASYHTMIKKSKLGIDIWSTREMLPQLNQVKLSCKRVKNNLGRVNQQTLVLRLYKFCSKFVDYYCKLHYCITQLCDCKLYSIIV